jgi:hypothetical protein
MALLVAMLALVALVAALVVEPELLDDPLGKPPLDVPDSPSP